MFHLSNKTKQSFIVGMGSVQHTKGIDRAIKAVAAIQTNKRPKLTWIANTSSKNYQDKMQKLASSLQVNLDFQIRIPDDKLRDLLSSAAVMIYTSRLEPFGLAPLEVIAIAEGGVRESIISGENGILISNETPQEMAEAILSFTENLDYATEFGIKACKHVRDIWGSVNAIDRLEKYLKETV
jgi:glycosyltransferase involved in cell wall biosynthesis